LGWSFRIEQAHPGLPASMPGYGDEAGSLEALKSSPDGFLRDPVPLKVT
jgi:hypothetical protein